MPRRPHPTMPDMRPACRKAQRASRQERCRTRRPPVPLASSSAQTVLSGVGWQAPAPVRTEHDVVMSPQVSPSRDRKLANRRRGVQPNNALDVPPRETESRGAWLLRTTRDSRLRDRHGPSCARRHRPLPGADRDRAGRREGRVCGPPARRSGRCPGQFQHYPCQAPLESGFEGTPSGRPGAGPGIAAGSQPDRALPGPRSGRPLRASDGPAALAGPRLPRGAAMYRSPQPRGSPS